jgi:hypothetical protein
MEVLKALDASMGMQTANICCLWRIVPLIHRFVRNINFVLSTRLHKYHTTAWLGHSRVFPGVIQAAPGTDYCVLYGLRNGHWTKIILQAHTFYVSGLATLHTVDNCEFFSYVVVGVKLTQKLTWVVGMKWELESARCWEGCWFQYLCICRQWACFVWCI